MLYSLNHFLLSHIQLWGHKWLLRKCLSWVTGSILYSFFSFLSIYIPPTLKHRGFYSSILNMKIFQHLFIPACQLNANNQKSAPVKKSYCTLGIWQESKETEFQSCGAAVVFIWESGHTHCIFVCLQIMAFPKWRGRVIQLSLPYRLESGILKAAEIHCRI